VLNKIVLSSLLLSSILMSSPNEIGYDISNETKVKEGLFINNNIYRFNKGPLIEIFYSLEHKGALMVKYKISNLANKSNPIKKRPSFYTEKLIPKKYRTRNKDYSSYNAKQLTNKTKLDKGHMAPHGTFDYDLKLLRKTYTLANVVPQYPSVNRHLWIKAEKFERKLASFVPNLTVTNIIKYRNKPNKMGDISIPYKFYKIISDGTFRVIFSYENNPDTIYKKDKLFSHIVTEIK